jgi:hypothetical protein
MSNTPHKDALTAAIKEMERYLPVLVKLESSPFNWEFCTKGTGIATTNGYKNALRKANAALQQSKGGDLEPGVQSPDSASVASHSCTETSLLSNMIAVANSMQREHNKWRYGQCLFNALNELSPSMANQLRATKYDCFYREDLIGQFIVKVEEMASSVLNVQRSVATEGDSSTGDDNLK